VHSKKIITSLMLGLIQRFLGSRSLHGEENLETVIVVAGIRGKELRAAAKELRVEG
jgi:hypothetical protein